MRAPEKKLCPVCGQIVEKALVHGYMTGRELGRPAGAKGADTSYVSVMCPSHGDVSPIEDAAEITAYQKWEKWIVSLPAELPGGAKIDKGRKVITDPWGNAIFDLPSRIVGMDELAAMVNDAAAEGIE